MESLKIDVNDDPVKIATEIFQNFILEVASMLESQDPDNAIKFLNQILIQSTVANFVSMDNIPVGKIEGILVNHIKEVASEIKRINAKQYH